MSDGRSSWAVALDGGANWVRNARENGDADIRRGRHSRHVRLVEVAGDEARHALKTYVTRAAFNRAYFEAGPEAPEDLFSADAERHPAFRIEPA